MIKVTKNGIIIRGRARHILIVFVLLLLISVLIKGIVTVSGAFVPTWMPEQTGAVEVSRTQAAVSSETAPQSSAASSKAASQNTPVSSESLSIANPMQFAASGDAPKDSSYFQAMYPNLYAQKVQAVPEKNGKTVYLTFDDGPSDLTFPLLDILDRYQVKATFFVVGFTDEKSLAAMRAIVNRGHTIAVHSYTHKYQEIYASPSAFLKDFSQIHDLIQKTTGVNTQIYRYAGGSVNDFDQSTARAITSEMDRRGYVYFDWNVSCGDGENHTSEQAIYKNTMSGVHSHKNSVILFHNSYSKGNTLAQMPHIIETLQKEGYQFKTLDASIDSRPYKFPLPKK